MQNENIIGKRFRDFRSDFIQEIIDVDEDTGVFSFIIMPDPKLYDEVIEDGEIYYEDKYRGYRISQKVLLGSLVEQGPGTPSYHLAPRIKNSIDYAGERQEAVSKKLEFGAIIEPTTDPLPYAPLKIADDHEEVITFISVDIVNSTVLSGKWGDKYLESYKILVEELGLLAGQFNASILKTTGDGVQLYLRHPSKTRQADNTIDLAVSIIPHIEIAINPKLDELQYPVLDVRVGADMGYAITIRHQITSANYLDFEISSGALNRACKIQGLADPKECLIGEDLRNYSHVGWLERSTLDDRRLHFGEDTFYSIYKIK